jgi:hypothetical protein
MLADPAEACNLPGIGTGLAERGTGDTAHISCPAVGAERRSLPRIVLGLDEWTTLHRATGET